jgi:hypothetical protein
MIEHMFASSVSSAHGYQALLDELRCRETDWLMAERDAVVREQRRLRLRELAITRVLDERKMLDDSFAARDGVSLRHLHRTRATAKALEDLPHIAAVAEDGRLSDAQLDAVSRLADPGSDAEWARRAPNCSPADLEDLARRKTKPTAGDWQARRAARRLVFGWRRDAGMLEGSFSLPDIDGVLVESVLNRMVDRMRPAKGQPWETRERRAADAFVELCRRYADLEDAPAPELRLVVQVPASGPATIAGIPLPDELVESVRAQAKIQAAVVDGDGAEVARSRATSAVAPRIARAVRLRDGKCRWPGCDRRTGLQVHHLWPRSWGGGDEIANLAAVCTGGGTDHHAQLVPHGPYALLGNPNQPDELALIHRDDLPALADLAATQARAGPTAAA